MFYSQVSKLCEERGEKITTATTALGFSKGNLSRWRSGNSPTADVVLAFANHFGVTTDYLLKDEESYLRLAERKGGFSMNEKTWGALTDFFLEISNNIDKLRDAVPHMKDIGVNLDYFDDWVKFNFDNAMPDESQIRKIAETATEFHGSPAMRFKFHQLANTCIHHMRQAPKAAEGQPLNNNVISEVANQ